MDHRMTLFPKTKFEPAKKAEPVKLQPDVLAGLISAAETMQHTFDECPELKDLYTRAYQQVLDTIKKNFEKSA